MTFIFFQVTLLLYAAGDGIGTSKYTAAEEKGT